MKSVLISIQPKWCELIASGKKTVEVRKTKPKIATPFKCYIYCTQDKRLLRKFDKGERIDDETFFKEHVFVRQNTWIRGHINPNGKVIGEFVCTNIAQGTSFLGSCLILQEISKYANGKELYGWCISDLIIYDKPKPLSDFIRCKYPWDCGVCDYWDSLCLTCNKPIRPPQSWCYVEERNG